MNKKETCIIKNCKRPMRIKKHGLCKPHLERYYKYGTVDPSPIRELKRHKPFDLKDMK
jgi:hypothetical protein